MKNIILLIFGLIFCTNLAAQTWWSDDAKWVYGHQNTGFPLEYIVQVYVDGTETINNVVCKVLKSNTRMINLNSNDTTFVEGIYGYAFQSGNKAWCFYDGDFIPIYDFDLNVVEIITLPLDDGSTVDLEVDQIADETIDGQSRRYYNMRIFSDCSAMDDILIKVIEGIGVDATLLEGYQGPFIHRMLDCFTPNPFNSLICHADTKFSYPDGSDCEQIFENVTPISDINNDLSFEVFPNPTVNVLEINNQVGAPIVDLEIYDELGKLISNNIPTNNIINVQELTPGIYYLKAYFDNEQVGMKRFLKF